MSTHIFNKTCGTCAVLGQPDGICALNGRRVNPETDFCSEWTNSTEKCDICGRVFIGPGTITQTEQGVKLTCPSCDNNINSCGTCVNAGKCDFNNPNIEPGLPPVVVKRIQRGPAVMEAQVRNPDREAAICPTCWCWKEEYGCCRENRTCGNYEIKFKH